MKNKKARHSEIAPSQVDMSLIPEEDLPMNFDNYEVVMRAFTWSEDKF